MKGYTATTASRWASALVMAFALVITLACQSEPLGADLSSDALEPAGETVPFELRFDRPFLWAVENRATGTILFLGIVTDPREEST